MARIEGFTAQMRATAAALDARSEVGVRSFGAELDGPACADLAARLVAACDLADASGDDHPALLCDLNAAVAASHLAACAGFCVAYSAADF